MSLKKNEILSEYIEYMLRIGMKVGEIQAVFPNVNGQDIHELGKKLGISTRMRVDNTLVAHRNTAVIKKFLQRFIDEYGETRDVSKVRILLKNIDYLAPTPNGRQRARKNPRSSLQTEQEER